MTRRSNPACKLSHPVSGTSVGDGVLVADGTLVGEGVLVEEIKGLGVRVNVGLSVEITTGVMVARLAVGDEIRIAVSVGTRELTPVDEPQAVSKSGSRKLKLTIHRYNRLRIVIKQLS